MRDYFLIAGMALCLFSLWAIARRDWVRLTTMSRSVSATVVGHRLVHDGEHRNWSAVYRFSAEGAEHEVVDQVSSSAKQPPEGTAVELSYPHGRPDLARPPRVVMWVAVYLLLTGLFSLLFGLWMGWIKN